MSIYGKDHFIKFCITTYLANVRDTKERGLETTAHALCKRLTSGKALRVIIALANNYMEKFCIPGFQLSYPLEITQGLGDT